MSKKRSLSTITLAVLGLLVPAQMSAVQNKRSLCGKLNYSRLEIQKNLIKEHNKLINNTLKEANKLINDIVDNEINNPKTNDLNKSTQKIDIDVNLIKIENLNKKKEKIKTGSKLTEIKENLNDQLKENISEWNNTIKKNFYYLPELYIKTKKEKEDEEHNYLLRLGIGATFTTCITSIIALCKKTSWKGWMASLVGPATLAAIYHGYKKISNRRKLNQFNNATTNDDIDCYITEVEATVDTLKKSTKKITDKAKKQFANYSKLTTKKDEKQAKVIVVNNNNNK